MTTSERIVLTTGVSREQGLGYGISKLALNGLTLELARELKDDSILINAVDPGLVATAEGMKEMGALPVSEAVGGIIWAATLPNDGPSGGFFRDKQPMAW